MRVLGGITYGVSLAALVGAMAGISTEAQAGAFAVREQSAYYQGMSFAGAGTGDTLSSMYWNSAAAAAAPGMNSESHISLIVPDSEITVSSGAALDAGLGAESGDIAHPSAVPASYVNYQVSDRLYIGLATNSGFGLVTKPDNQNYAGSVIAITSDVFSANVNPTIAYKLTPELTVGVGVQLEYLSVRLTNTSRTADLDDIGVGATAGVTWKPSQGTTLGIGWRSSVDFELDGDFRAAGFNSDNAKADLTLPDMITIGIRQRLGERLDLLVGYEWTNWSRVGTIPVKANGIVPEELRLEYDDGHFVSAGLEYDYSPSTTLRAGIAWEKSPISDQERNVFLPDSDRLWLSVGATFKYSEKTSFDIGYTHIFSDDAPICRSVVGGGPCAAGEDNLIVAEGEASVNIITASFKYKWGGSEPALEPLK
jgi:long-chain fatty acid transport protein